jgi:hypothetical protein
MKSLISNKTYSQVFQQKTRTICALILEGEKMLQLDPQSWRPWFIN